jgi:hypothetical protein
MVVSGGHACDDEPVARHSYKYIHYKKAKNIGGHCYCFKERLHRYCYWGSKKLYRLQYIVTVTEAEKIMYRLHTVTDTEAEQK